MQVTLIGEIFTATNLQHTRNILSIITRWQLKPESLTYRRVTSYCFLFSVILIDSRRFSPLSLIPVQEGSALRGSSWHIAVISYNLVRDRHAVSSKFLAGQNITAEWKTYIGLPTPTYYTYIPTLLSSFAILWHFFFVLSSSSIAD